MKQTASVSKHLSGSRAPRRVGAPSGPRNAERRRATLLRAASALFVERGYEATTMEEIALGAGITKGTLYHYFASKIELLEALREGFDEEVMNRVQLRVESCAVDEHHARLQSWIEAAVDAYFEMSELHDAIYRSAGMPRRYAMANAKITQSLAKLITAGTKAGAWQVDDALWTAIIMFYGYVGGCDEAILGTRCAEDVSEKLYYLFLRMLRAYE